MKIHCTRLKYASDKTIKEKLEIWFIKDHSKAIKFRIFNLILKVLTCVLYVIEVLMDPISVNYSSSPSNKHKNANVFHATISSQSSANLLENTTAHGDLKHFISPTYHQQDSSPIYPTSSNDDINWHNVFFVNRHPIVRNIQLAIAIYGLFETLFYFYLCYNGNGVGKIKNAYFYIELIGTVPWIVEYFAPKAKDIFIPVFLNCWLIKRNLNYIFKDFNNINIKHHNSVIGQHLISLATLFFCLIFTSVCGFQHLQRANLKESVTLFDSLYYIIITFSTVGYGDITPNTWPSKLFMGVMIIVALVVIPTQLEHLASLWFERQNLGASYSSHRAANEKHVVICSTNLQYDLIIDFLHEFYAHRKNHSIHTILLSSSELDIQLRSLLHTPLWKQRVFYIHGSALRDTDLERAKVHQAKAVFIIASRGIDKDLADQHSILRSWAIKDFAPHTPQFVQLFRPENKINIKFAEHLVCEDEFKYGLLANNCLCPGISTLVTLLLHKSKISQARETDENLEKWQQIYSKLAGNEIHSITAENSKFFQEFIGKSFVNASCMAHKKYNVCLIGVGKHRPRMSMAFSCDDINLLRSDSDATSDDRLSMTNKSQQLNLQNRSILLNPGPHYEIEPHDICYYISLVKEENYNWKSFKSKISFAVEELYQNMLAAGPDLSLRMRATELTAISEDLGDANFNVSLIGDKVLEAHAGEFNQPEVKTNTTASNSNDDHSMKTTSSSLSHRKNLHEIKNSDIVVGKPPYPLYIGCNPTFCKLLKVPNQLCCLELNRECEHKTCAQATDYKWKNKCILVVAEYATNGLFNFILPLRAQVRSIMFLRPIVLLLENTPTIEFLEAISPFPLVYWMKGSISNISTILKAGVMDSETVVVVSPEKYAQIDDDSLTDCSNIVSVQNLYRLFPKIKVVAELTKASNIRFMKFRAKEMIYEDSLNLDFNSLDMGYMLRQPFAAGHVFSASMIDTLLYQTFGKPYLIELIRLLIGISQTSGSGNLTSIPLTENDMWIKTYGNLYRKLTTSTGEIPIGLYRTKHQERRRTHRIPSKLDIHQMILIKMNKLGIDPDKYKHFDEFSSEKCSFVLINPSSDFVLKPGDIIYLLKPGNCNNTHSNNIQIIERQFSNPQQEQQINHASNDSTDKQQPTITNNEALLLEDIIQQNQEQHQQSQHNLNLDKFKFGQMPTSSHLSIDESWLEEMAKKRPRKRDSFDYIASKLNLSNLKRMFLPSSLSSLSRLSTPRTTTGPPINPKARHDYVLNESTFNYRENYPRVGLFENGKARSKSIVTTYMPNDQSIRSALKNKILTERRFHNQEEDAKTNTSI